MKALLVVGRPEDWPFEIPGTVAVSAEEYLTGGDYAGAACKRVVNLCRNDRYQRQGFYVSLLAEARGHHPLPDVKTLEDLHAAMADPRLTSRIESLVQEPLAHETALHFDIHAYFGAEPGDRLNSVCAQLFALVPVPLLRARFLREAGADGEVHWRLEDLQALSLDEVPAQHRESLARAARAFFGSGQRKGPARKPALAILYNRDAAEPPSNPLALKRCIDAARTLGMDAEIIDRHAIDRLDQFDALFIRDTTHLGHYTWEFARRAADLGLTVIDHPASILQCNNKVFLHELLTRHGLPTPKTVLVHRGNVGEVIRTLGLPCVLKQPDSEFSLGVRCIRSEDELHASANALLQKSDLLIAQEWIPTSYDWRIGMLDRRPFFICKYFMAPGHWQVIKREPGGRVEGRTSAVPIGLVPRFVLEAAWNAADLIGDGLYGVDVKQQGDRCYVIEVNDNPNIDAGNEDGVLGDALYLELMAVFLRRITEQRSSTQPRGTELITHSAGQPA